MGPVRFWTKYGYKVMGGRFDVIRSPSCAEELNAPIVNVSPDVVAQSEASHEAALKMHLRRWNLLREES
jgi:hypothetical protein